MILVASFAIVSITIVSIIVSTITVIAIIPTTATTIAPDIAIAIVIISTAVITVVIHSSVATVAQVPWELLPPMDLLCQPPLHGTAAPPKRGRPATVGRVRGVKRRPAANDEDAEPAVTLPRPTAMPTIATRPASWPSVVTFGSVCSGLGTEKWACPLNAGRHVTLFTCDTDRHAARFLKANNVGQYHFKDVGDDEFQNGAPPVDVFIGGFPCQPFSAAGLNHGTADDRGLVIMDIYKYVEKARPKIIILENVPGLLTHHGETLLTILALLKGIGGEGTAAYTLHWKILDSREVGAVPQRRQRLWIVMLSKAHLKCPFKWPTQRSPVSLHTILDSDSVAIKNYDTWYTPAKLDSMRRTMAKNIRLALERVAKKAADTNVRPESLPVVVDTNSTGLSISFDETPCITKSRAAARAFWLLQYGRPLSIRELLRCQGFDPTRMRLVGTDCQMGARVGNAFTCTVLRAILMNALASVGVRA